MRVISGSKCSMIPMLLAMAAMPISANVSAQPQDAAKSDITVTGEPLPPASEMTAGPEIKGIISARSGNKIKVKSADGSSSIIYINEATKISASKGLFSNSKVGAQSLLNGLPVSVKTLQWPGGLLASQVNFRNGDFKTANMIHNGTDQRFTEQAAATEALRGRMADIDNYNIKSTLNVHFDTGKAVLSPQARAELCTTAAQAEAMKNAFILVVGYTDSVGSEEYNQVLSEKRAGSVINYLQQACHWKPYRMLTPTGMAEADPLASNDTPEGKALNRRVSVNVLVSKALEDL